MRTASLMLLSALAATTVAGLPPGDGAPPPDGSRGIRVLADGTVFPVFPVQAMSGGGEVVLHAESSAPACSVLALIAISRPTPAARLYP